MWKLMNNTQRSFIVGKDDVLKGGLRRTYPAGPTIREEIELRPGNYIYEVTDECGKTLSSFFGIFIMEKNGVAVVPEEHTEELSSEERIKHLEEQIKILTAKKTRKPKETKK